MKCFAVYRRMAACRVINGLGLRLGEERIGLYG